MKNKTFHVALCGVIASLAVVIMLSTALVPIATYAAPALAGVIMAVLVIEINKKWALAAYFTASIISILIVPDKEAVALFVLFFGYYPVLKQLIESNIQKKLLQLLLKVFCFSVAAITSYFIAIGILGISAEEFDIFGVNLPILFLFAGIIIFIIFDNALSGVIVTYVNKLRDKLFGKFIKKSL